MIEMNAKDQLLEILTPAGREILLRQSVEKRFSTGEVLWTTGDRSDGITLVLEGKVRIVRSSRGRQLVIHSGEPGDTLGEIPFFTRSCYPATAIAAEPTRCLLLTDTAVTRAMAVDPGLAFFFLKRLSSRVQALVEKVNQLTASSVQARLAHFILERHQTSRAVKRSAADSHPAVVLSLGMTQSALAEELGTVREVLVRALRGLREVGAIESVGAGKYAVSNLVLLESLSKPAS